MSVTQEREVLTTLLNDVAKLHEVAETLPAGDERAQALESVAERWLASAPGLRPSIAAVLLGLSEPTVRAWAKRGILRVRSGKPRLLWSTPAKGGTFTVQLIATDLAGNFSTASGTVLVSRH